MSQRFSVAWLPNGFVSVFDRGSKLRCLVDPSTGEIRHGDLSLSPAVIQTLLARLASSVRG